MLEAYEQLKELIASADDDVRRAAGGNKAAGTRIRKLMQDVKNSAQVLRVKVLEARDTSAS
ncbi:MAG: histone H1 [Phycisphaeraceae bacterium]|nr:histone H1 [Phycisphaeraceae bacterium]|tara:strand:- start:47 stop:229 length:183 start_codon:yes stop_codon:yes gene_type:complete